jgi:hypothetical protein
MSSVEPGWPRWMIVDSTINEFAEFASVVLSQSTICLCLPELIIYLFKNKTKYYDVVLKKVNRDPYLCKAYTAVKLNTFNLFHPLPYSSVRKEEKS